jgi:hypothetical protein
MVVGSLEGRIVEMRSRVEQMILHVPWPEFFTRIEMDQWRMIQDVLRYLALLEFFFRPIFGQSLRILCEVI